MKKVLTPEEMTEYITTLQEAMIATQTAILQLQQIIVTIQENKK